MLRALANYLNGKDFPLLGAMPKSTTPLMKLAAQTVNHLPLRLREQIYIWSGRFEAIRPDKLRDICMDQIAEDLTRLYPKRQYPQLPSALPMARRFISGPLWEFPGCRRLC